MAHKSIREIRADLRRTLSGERFVDALLVVLEPDGRECYRAGGVWDRLLDCYDHRRQAKPHYFTLQPSQVESSRAFSEWLTKSRQGDKRRDRVLMYGGPGGSGKTTQGMGPELVATALEWPGEVQFGVNLQSKLRRECIDAIRDTAPEAWIESDTENPVDSRTVFLTGSWIGWLTAKNQKALRQRKLPIRRVVMNEAQDMPAIVFANSLLALRNTGGLLSILANPNQEDVGDWSSELWEKLQGSKLKGRQFWLDPRQNRAIDQDALSDIGDFLQAVAPESYTADILGQFNARDGKGYPAFTHMAREVDEAGRYVRGHVGLPELRWRDVTKDETARLLGPGSTGFDFVGGSDFQMDPGCCVNIGKLYRDQFNDLVLYIHETISAPGDERALTQALVSRSYFPGEVDFNRNPRPGRSLLLVGDGTSSTHSTGNRKGEPYTFLQLQSQGWRVIGPDRHFSTGTWVNPLVPDSRKQMHALFKAGQILLSPDCEQPSAVLPSLVDGFKRTRLLPSGRFEKKGHWTHAPDGVRYLAWRFLPRSRPAPVDTTPDLSVFAALKRRNPHSG